MDEKWLAWLIERHRDGKPMDFLFYDHGVFNFTTDPLAALHFVRREDADSIAGESNDNVLLRQFEFIGGGAAARTIV